MYMYMIAKLGLHRASTSGIAIAHLSLINTSTIKIFSYLLMMKYKHTNKYVRM